MKKILKSSLALLLSTVSLSAWNCFDQKLQLNVGPNFNYARYNLGGLPKIHGYLAGIHTNLTYSDKFYAQARFDGLWNAADVCGDPCTRADVADYRPEVYLGYNFRVPCTDCFFVTPLVGATFNILSFELEPSVVDFGFRTISIPVGFDLLWRGGECSYDIGLRAVYRANVYDKVKLENPYVRICDKIDLETAHGVHLEMPFIWNNSWGCLPNAVFKIVPYFDWLQFGKAEDDNSHRLPFEIPELKRWYLGLRFEFGITF